MRQIDLLYVALVWAPAVFVTIAGFGILASENVFIRLLSWILPAAWVVIGVVALFWAHETDAAETELYDALSLQVGMLACVSMAFMVLMVAVELYKKMFARPNRAG